MQNKYNAPFEVVVKVLLVQEHPGISELAVEPVLELADTAHGALYITVPREHEDGRIGALARVVRGRVRVIGVVVRVWDGRWCGVGRPREAAGELGDGGRAAVRFVGEAENRVNADLRARQRVAGRMMRMIRTRMKKTRRA